MCTVFSKEPEPEPERKKYCPAFWKTDFRIVKIEISQFLLLVKTADDKMLISSGFTEETQIKTSTKKQSPMIKRTLPSAYPHRGRCS